MSQEYMDNVQKYYLASVESADFVSAAEESRKMINCWVECETNGRLWESRSLKVTAESPLCEHSAGPWPGFQERGWDEIAEGGEALQGGTVHVSAERPRRGCSQDQPPAGTAESGRQCLCGSQVCSNIRLSHKFSLK